MRNQEAARYARWAAITAGVIAGVVVVVYAQRALRGYMALRHGPKPVPETVQQESAGVSYSFSNQNGTTFTIRASHATQFKEGDYALLQDVWVTIYGKKGNRNDNIHTQECSYQPDAGNVQCKGKVEIDMGGIGGQSRGAVSGLGSGSSAGSLAGSLAGSMAGSGRGAMDQAVGEPLHVTTSDVTFNKETGEASTPAAVKLNFPGGEGQGSGLDYKSGEATLRLEHNVSFSMAASQKTGGLPVRATAANLEFQRDTREVTLGGPVVVHQGDRQLAAQQAAITLDKQYHAHEIAAEGEPVVSGEENGSSFTITAQRIDGTLDANGAIQQITASGAVTGSRKSRLGEDHFSAARVELAMLPGRNLLRQMTASGAVNAESRAKGSVRTLKTSALEINFAVPDQTFGKLRPDQTFGKPRTATGAAAPGMNNQKIESAETLGPATVESKTVAQTLELKAARLDAQFGADGNLQELRGHSGVQIVRSPQNGQPQTSRAAELAATFGAGGEWQTLDETGHVTLTQGGELATAGHAHVVNATDTIVLEGSPVFSDGTTRTSAGAVTINQKSGEIRASGGVISTEMAPPVGKGKAMGADASAAGFGNISLGQGDAHLSAEALNGSVNSGDVTFVGHARLWQGQAVLDADQIGISRQTGSLIATGNVVGVFPQQPGTGPQIPKTNAGKRTDQAGAVVWQIRAKRLTYANASGEAMLDGGVTASSEQGSLTSRSLEVYFAQPAAGATRTPVEGYTAQLGGLERAVARGGVVVSQNGVHGYADQAEYSAATGKFVFSGGQPRITDQDGNTTTGHSLTFDVANDTISVDSEKGSRTLTRHRVEK